MSLMLEEKYKYHTLKLEKINTNVIVGSSSLLDTIFIFREVSSYNRGECVVHETNVNVGELESLLEDLQIVEQKSEKVRDL